MPGPTGIGENGLIREQCSKQLRLDLDRSPVNPLEHCGIETEFIVKVAKDQDFV